MKSSRDTVKSVDYWICPKCGDSNSIYRLSCGNSQCYHPRPPQFNRISLGTDPGKDVSPVPMDGRKRREPNKLEQRWADTHPEGDWKYEAVSLRLQSGHRYTPDWYDSADDENRGKLVECKPAPKTTKAGKRWTHSSYQRARLAFDEARIQFPEFRFIWVEWDGKQWREK